MTIKDIIDIAPEKLSSGFSAALRIGKKIKGSKDSDDVIDFSRARFVTPTFELWTIYPSIRSLNVVILLHNAIRHQNVLIFALETQE